MHTNLDVARPTAWHSPSWAQWLRLAIAAAVSAGLVEGCRRAGRWFWRVSSAFNEPELTHGV